MPRNLSALHRRARYSKFTIVRLLFESTRDAGLFLEETDLFGTRKFDPWRQRTIYEYARRDALDSFVFPAPLRELFLTQMDKYGGATDATFQRLRYLRDGVFRQQISRERAAAAAPCGEAHVFQGHDVVRMCQTELSEDG